MSADFTTLAVIAVVAIGTGLFLLHQAKCYRARETARTAVDQMRQFMGILDAPHGSNPGLERLMAVKPPWTIRDLINEGRDGEVSPRVEGWDEIPAVGKELPEFDMAQHIKTDADIAEYLSQGQKDGDPGELAAALGHIAKAVEMKNDKN